MGVILPPRGALANVWRQFWLSDLRGAIGSSESGDIFGCYKLRECGWEELLLHLAGRGQGCSQTPYNAQDKSHNRELSSPNATSWKILGCAYEEGANYHLLMLGQPGKSFWHSGHFGLPPFSFFVWDMSPFASALWPKCWPNSPWNFCRGSICWHTASLGSSYTCTVTYWIALSSITIPSALPHSHNFRTQQDYLVGQSEGWRWQFSS